MRSSCERENKWLSETLYYIDTSLIPRGGARRRKSMEPKALANHNGTLVSGTGKTNSSRDSLGPPVTPIGRRQSTLWVRTPSDQGDDAEDEDDVEWSKFILTPAPKTPAPEAVAKYAANLYDSDDSDEENFSADNTMTAEEHRQLMLTRTCPPKATVLFADLGKGVLGQEQDESVRMRLMAARRKSLQFAPKVGSPLSRTWK